MRRLVLALLILSILSSVILADNGVLKCATCGRVINKTKHYLEYDGKAYCSEACFQAALPKCATCGKVVGEGKKSGEYFKYHGKIYCSQACFEEALPKCPTCGKPVNGGVVADGKSYCNQACYQQSLPKCAVCGKPVNGGLRNPIEPGKVYCSQECFNTTLPKCAICGRRMQSWKTLAGANYCDSCAQLPRCSDCKRPGADVKLADGRLLCRKCDNTALFDTLRSRQLFERTRTEISEQLGLSTDHRIRFHAVDLKQLKKATKADNSSEQGYYSHYYEAQESAGVWRNTNDEYDIFLLNGLQSDEFRDVAAHELAHDIQQALYPRLKDKIVKEGFAEYVASLMETAWGNEAINQERLKNEFKDYVNGFQKMAQIGKDGGLPAVLEYLKKLNRKGK
jgi:hypothetical protein